MCKNIALVLNYYKPVLKRQ